MAETFRNWSGSVEFTPSSRTRPSDVDDIVDLVNDARTHSRILRPVGSAHSSQPLFDTPDTLIHLDHLSGVKDVDRDNGLATVLPGTGLSDMDNQLDEHGWALSNLGDVDYQTIAGAIGTGTHGSGVTLGNLSSFLVGGRLINGRGEEVAFGTDAGHDKDHDLLRAAQVSLGSLGVMTSLTLQVEESYDLHRQNWITHIDWVLDNFEEMMHQNRILDFYWYPRNDLAKVRMLNKPGQEPDLIPPGTLRTDETGPSYRIIPNDRHLHFEEMEYMLPLDPGLEVFRQVRQRIKERHRATVGWRVLVRTIAPDQAMLSNAQGQPTMTIALLQNNTLPHEDYFNDMEPLFREAGGRPHWGKNTR